MRYSPSPSSRAQQCTSLEARLDQANDQIAQLKQSRTPLSNQRTREAHHIEGDRPVTVSWGFAEHNSLKTIPLRDKRAL